MLMPGSSDPFPGAAQELHPLCSALGASASGLHPELLHHRGVHVWL